jgi:hypothetical protein
VALHFPTVLGADVPSYNIPGITDELNFTPQALAEIYLGKITKWNDLEIVKVNPKVKFPPKTSWSPIAPTGAAPPMLDRLSLEDLCRSYPNQMDRSGDCRAIPVCRESAKGLATQRAYPFNLDFGTPGAAAEGIAGVFNPSSHRSGRYFFR